MLTPAEALERILRSVAEVAPLPPERVALADALGRVLAADLRAPRALPPFPAATMDGYALRAADAPRPGAALPIAFEVAAGHPSTARLPRGACCRIFTGAPLPTGADGVEMQEEVAREGGTAVFARPAQAGRFVRPVGDDVARGAVALRAGAVIDPGAIGLAASLGQARLAVHRRPRVAILPTGDEVIPLGRRPGAGQIIESNSHALAACVAEAGGLPTLFPVVQDEAGALERAVRRARGFDVLVTSGGVSVGEKDLVRGALEAAGARLDFWKVAARPGKPVAFGRLGRTLVFGLPGNPASTLVAFELYARPALRALAGLAGTGRHMIRGRLALSMEKPPGLTVYVRVRVERRDGALLLTPLRTQVSGNLTSTTGHQALAVLPPGRRRLAQGSWLDAILVAPVPPP